MRGPSFSFMITQPRATAFLLLREPRARTPKAQRPTSMTIRRLVMAPLRTHRLLIATDIGAAQLISTITPPRAIASLLTRAAREPRGLAVSRNSGKTLRRLMPLSRVLRPGAWRYPWPGSVSWHGDRGRCNADCKRRVARRRRRTNYLYKELRWRPG